MVDDNSVVVVDKYTPLNLISIWSPRYHDNKVLINPRKVGDHNKIVFTKAPSLPLEYYMSGKMIRSFKKESNGSIMCFCVPVEELKVLKINEKDWRALV